jgi:hypothetical protein
MSAQRPQHFFVILALGVGAVSLPRVAAAQGCVAHTCTAVNRVTVTVPPRLALSPAPTGVAVQANTAWRLDVSPVASGANQGASPAAPAQAERRAAARTAIRDTPAAGAAVRYTLVAS